MNYFDDRKNVEDYIKMAEGFDGRELIEVLRNYLPDGATVLELGMGPGKDLSLLNRTYAATGSDSSDVFLELYGEKHPGADLLKLDAVSLNTERVFDCVYSNKVLHHLTKDDLKRSFDRQHEILNGNGLLMHSFWLGDKEEEHHGLRFVYYMEEDLLKLIDSGFEVVKTARYKEIEAVDSFYVLLRKRE